MTEGAQMKREQPHPESSPNTAKALEDIPGLSSFGTTARALVTNPLGIIGLFIVLVYAFAALVVVFAGGLQPDERKPLIWFLALFPPTLLVVFAWLVVKHHRKLYGPRDFRDETLFVLPQGPEGQRERLITEIRETLPSVGPDQLMAPGSGIPKIDSSDAISTYVLAEDLSLRVLEAELQTPIQRHVKLQSPGGKYMGELDGFAHRSGEAIAIEVKLGRPLVGGRRIEEIIAKFEILHGLFETKETRFRSILVIVSAGEPSPSELMDNAVKMTKDLPFIEVRFYRFDDLKEKFGISN